MKAKRYPVGFAVMNHPGSIMLPSLVRQLPLLTRIYIIIIHRVTVADLILPASSICIGQTHFLCKNISTEFIFSSQLSYDGLWTMPELHSKIQQEEIGALRAKSN